MVYESFKNSKNKFQRTWERSQENENNLKDIPLVTLDFNSINFSKKIVNIPILTNQLTTLGVKLVTILLENFPETSLNMIEPIVIHTLTDGFVSRFIPITFSEAFSKGILKNGDVHVFSQFLQYWFNHIDQKHFLLKIKYGVNPQEAIVSEIGFSSTAIPIFTTLSLKIINQRIYEQMNEKKE